MRLFRCSVFALLVSLAFLARAKADQDTIPLIQWKPGDPTSFEMFFHNQVHPDPSYKVFQFVGNATSLTVAPTTFDILVYFDYIDSSGTSVLIPPAPFGYHNVLPADGVTRHIEGGPYILDFCPAEVSIHFEINSEVPIQFDGLFDHTCIHIPEPGSGLLLILIGTGLLSVSRRG